MWDTWLLLVVQGKLLFQKCSLCSRDEESIERIHPFPGNVIRENESWFY
jgi:hypothetical protein